jgi:hypothetical protein
MTADGQGRHADDEVGTEDASESIVRQFLQSIADRPADAVPTRRGFSRPADRERQVMRFAWMAEELNVAIGDLDLSDPNTVELLVEHAVPNTLLELRIKAAKVIRTVDGARGLTTQDALDS